MDSKNPIGVHHLTYSLYVILNFEKGKTTFEQGGGWGELATNNEEDSEDCRVNDKITYIVERECLSAAEGGSVSLAETS